LAPAAIFWPDSDTLADESARCLEAFERFTVIFLRWFERFEAIKPTMIISARHAAMLTDVV
jgi:hypothetical protein